MPSWLSFATHLADRRGLFSKNPLSQVQDFLLKVDMALTQPIAEAKKELARLRRDVGIAHVTKGADPQKVFPVLQAHRPVRATGLAAIDHSGPIEIVSTMSPEEARRDIELLLKAERRGTMTAEDLFGPEERSDDDSSS